MPLVFALVACLGHLVLMIGSHNFIYGLPLGKRLGDVMHLVHAALVLALPVVLVAGFGWLLEGLFDASEFWHQALLGYLTLCVAVVVVWLPFVTWRRHSRREPGEITHSEVIDTPTILGKRPAGEGHHGFLAALPGTQIFQIELIERTVRLPRLPHAWEGLTLLHLSDVHFHGTPDREYYQVLIQRCAAWQPDLVAITGDIADSPTHHEWIVPLLGELRWKIAGFAILGNHDHRYDVGVIRGELRKLAFHIPINDWLEVTVRDERLIVVGHEGPWLADTPDLTTCPEGFRLCLSHSPDNLAWARNQGIDLMLSGHVHGGQIRLPVIGSVLVPSTYGRRYDGGLFEASPTVLHVSRGISGEHPVRYNCRPEVTLLRLTRGV